MNNHSKHTKQETSTIESCRWIRIDGTKCQDTKLVLDSQYCSRHYWQALWAKSTLSETPLPSHTDWGSLGVFAGFMILFLIGYAINPNWIFPYWLQLLQKVISNPKFAQTTPFVVIDLVGWFAIGASIITLVWLEIIIGCYFPLKPKTRKIYLASSLSIYGLLGVTKIVASIYSLALTSNVQPAWIIGIFVTISFFQKNLLVYLSADRLNPKIISRYGLLSYGMVGLTLVVASIAYIFLLGESSVIIILRVINACYGLLTGVLLINTSGRSIIINLLNETAATLADNMRPANAQVLGFSLPTPDVRRQALKRALDIYSNLTPLEQQELEDYVIVKRRPSLLQTAIGIVTIVLSAFLLEAPAQQLFIWFACHFLQLGVPLCP